MKSISPRASASFYAHESTPAACAAKQRQRRGRGKMHDVNAGAEFAGEANQEGDGVAFGFRRARGEPSSVALWICSREARGGGFDRAGQFRVREQRRAEACEDGQSRAEIALGDVRKFRHA
jgi:hypothetical protein